MLKRIIPLMLLLFTLSQAQAQYPEKLVLSGPPALTQMVCPPGANPDAGTSTQSIDASLFPTNQTSNVQFLCLGDSMQVLHFGGNLSGDPTPGTPGGFSYIFYRCPPSAAFDGPELSNILMDPCLYPNAGVTQLTTVQPSSTPITPDGNATFFNNGGLQALDGGAPVSVWFAPFTADFWPTMPGQQVSVENGGACMNVNTSDAFNVIYLNEITISSLNNNAGGNGCVGTMNIRGGLAEFAAGAPGSDKLYNITITKVSDPSIVGFPENGWEHDETLSFRVPEAGLYEIVVEDGVSCGASAQVMMGTCAPTSFIVPDTFALAGTNFCLPIFVEDFVDVVSFQMTINWDPAIYTFTPPIMAGDLNPSLLQANLTSPGEARVIWFEPMVGSSPVTLMDGQVAFKLCLDVIGNPGDISPFVIQSNDFEVATTGNITGSGTQVDGSVLVVSNNMTLSFTSCASLSTASMDVGSFTVTVTGGAGPYTFAYQEVGNAANSGTGTIPFGDDTGEITGLPPGTYNVVVTDAMSNVQVGMVTIVDADPLEVRINPFSDPSCNGSTDGSVALQQLGGIAPFQIAWSTGAMNVSMLNNLPADSYTVSVTDANGCLKESTQALFTPQPLVIMDTIIQHISCTNGPNDGSITIIPSGGPTNIYTYLWGNGNMTNSISTLIAGTYCVDVTSGTCTSNFCFDVDAPLPPTITGVDSMSISCPGINDGELTVLFTPGFGAITDSDIVWDNGETGPTISNLAPGDYTVTITASDGCTATETFRMGSGGFSIALNVSPPTCSYTPNGLISVTISPPPGPGDTYTFQWSNGGTGSFISDLLCGEAFSVTVSDGSACPGLVETVNLDCPPDILITFDPNSIQPVRCFGLEQPLCDGQASVIASSGTTNNGNYNFIWNNSPDMQNGGSQHTATQLCQGWNTVVVSDLDCNNLDSVFIPAPDELVLNLDSNRIERPSCFGDSDGSISVAAQGGTSPYVYNWSTGSPGQMISGLSRGDYTVTITDLRNCVHTVTIPLDEPELLIASIDPDNTNDALCNDSEDGQISIIWTGGNQGPIQFDWSPDVASSQLATGLAPGLYSVTITDPEGCTAETSHVVSNPPPINFVMEPVNEPNCFGETTVIRIATASGGDGGPYKFSVGGATRSTMEPVRVLAGPLTVTVFDDSQCSSDTNIVVNQPPQIIVDLGPELEEIDLGASTIIDANISPPNVALEALVWTPTTNLICDDFINGDSTLCDEVEVSPLATTTYTLTAIDENGCEGSNSIIIDVDKNRNVYIPNVFSPNGDGVNDFFQVLGGVGVQQVNFMRVYNRWGALMHEALNFQPTDGELNMAWNGTFGGKLMNPGVYVYLIEVQFIDETVLLYRGDITLLY